MIKIDDIYYDATLEIRKINIRGKFEDVIVLNSKDKFENIYLIKTDEHIYKIGDILKWFEEEDIYWLELLATSENLEDKKIVEIEQDLIKSQQMIVELQKQILLGGM